MNETEKDKKGMEILRKYLPESAIELSLALIKQYNIQLKIVDERKSKHGDYQRLEGGDHRITINSCLNRYKFLITLIHEIAHLVVREKYGSKPIRPHGREWKETYKKMMLPLLNSQIFPAELSEQLKKHFIDPKATTDTDVVLSILLRQYDRAQQDKTYLFELREGQRFYIAGRVFEKGEKKIKRYLCTEVDSGKKYVIYPHAVVEPI